MTRTKTQSAEFRKIADLEEPLIILKGLTQALYSVSMEEDMMPAYKEALNGLSLTMLSLHADIDSILNPNQTANEKKLSKNLSWTGSQSVALHITTDNLVCLID